MNNPSTIDRRDVAHPTNPIGATPAIEQDDIGRPAQPAADPQSGMRRSGGTSGDPHGGHERIDDEWHGPDPDPVDELVPAGDGGLPPSVNGTRPESLAFTATQEPNLPEGDAGADLVSGEQPVEGALNRLRIDPVTGMPEIEDEAR